MADLSAAQLRAFVVAARLGSLSAAAVDLDLTQSAVSHALRQLEAALDTRVLLRHGRGVRLSVAGARLLPLAEQLLADLAALKREASAVSAVRGRVRIAAFPSLTRALLPDVLAELAWHAPDLRVEVNDYHLDRRDVIEAVQSGQADIGLTQLLPGSALQTRALGHDPYQLIAPENWPLHSVWSRPYIHLGDCQDLEVPRSLARHGLSLEPSLSLSSETAILALVARQLGFALLPEMAIPPLPSGVVRHALPWPVARTYGTVTRPGAVLPGVQAVLDVLWRLPDRVRTEEPRVPG